MAIFFEVLAFLVFILGIWYDNKDLIEAFEFILSLGLVFFSLYFACYSIVIADESDKKMKSVANSEFLHAVNMLEDARIEFIKTLKFIDSLTTVPTAPATSPVPPTVVPVTQPVTSTPAPATLPVPSSAVLATSPVCLP